MEMDNRDRVRKAGSPDERKQRLAAQLRANLGKRKAQARARAEASDDAPETDGGQGSAKGG